MTDIIIGFIAGFAVAVMAVITFGLVVMRKANKK